MSLTPSHTTDPAIAPRQNTRFRSIKGHVMARVPRAGKIRLGVKRISQKSGNPYPAEVEHFVFDDDLPGRDRILKLFGQDPKRLRVMFLSDDPEEVFPIAYKAYRTGTGLFCRGNGEEAERIVMTEDGGRQVPKREQIGGRPVTEDVECTCPLLAAGKCHAVGNLMVVLPEVGFTAYQIDTGSIHSMTNIRNALAHYKALLGSLVGVPFALVRKPVVTHGSGRPETHYPLFLEMLPKDEMEAMKRTVAVHLADYNVLGAGATYESPAELPPGSQESEHDIIRGREIPEGLDAEVGGPDGPDDFAGGSPVDDLNRALEGCGEPGEEPGQGGAWDLTVAELREALLEESVRGQVKDAATELGFPFETRGEFKALKKGQLVKLYDEVMPF